MNLAPPIPRLERPRRSDSQDAATDRATANRTPVKARTGALRRERHQADYVILVAVVALTAIGILMVYSSSAMKAYLERDDTFAIVGPQIVWGALGIGALLVTMRIDYRLLPPDSPRRNEFHVDVRRAVLKPSEARLRLTS